MNVLQRDKIEISQRLKQLEVNEEIKKLRKDGNKKKENPKKTINNILNYFNNIFSKIYCIYLSENYKE